MEEPISVRLSALNHAAVLFSAMLFCIVLWMVTRYPNSSVLVVSIAMMSAGAAYDIQNVSGRIRLLFSAVTGAGFFQFITGMLLSCRVLLLIAGFLCTYCLARLIKHRRTAGITIAVGHLALSASGGFMASFDRLIETGLSGIAAFITLLILPLIHSPDNWKPEQDGGLTQTESIRLACSTTLGVFLYFALRIPEGIWIPATSAYLYMSKSRGADLRPMAGSRLWGTVLGMYAGFLFLGCFSYFEYRMIYLVPFIAGIGFFILYYTGNYLLYSLCFMMSFCLGADLMTPQTGNIYLFQLSVSRILSTSMGCCLTILFERFFLRDYGGEPEHAIG